MKEKKLAKELEDKIISSLPESQNKDKVLGIIQVGESSGSIKYADLKKKFCDAVGVKCTVYKINEFAPDENIISEIEGIIKDDKNGGIIIQCPLPRPSLKSVLDLIPLNKDIDVLSSKSIERFNSGDFTVLPPVVRAFDFFINTFGIDLQNKTSIVIGYGALVGKPLSVYLARKGAKVSVLDNYQTGQKIDADILVLSTGVPRLVNGDDVADGCAIVDFGYSNNDGKTVGDFNLNSKIEHLSYLSPSPGGMGPLDVRFLVMNFLGI